MNSIIELSDIHVSRFLITYYLFRYSIALIKKEVFKLFEFF